MSFAQTTDVEAAFVDQVATNIKAVLAMRRLTGTDAAKLIGMSTQKFSQRMTGASRWLAVDLDRLARVLEVSPAVLLAHDETEFRDRLSRSGWTSLNAVPEPADPRIPLFSADDLTPYNATPPSIAIAS